MREPFIAYIRVIRMKIYYLCVTIRCYIYYEKTIILIYYRIGFDLYIYFATKRSKRISHIVQNEISRETIYNIIDFVLLLSKRRDKAKVLYFIRNPHREKKSTYSGAVGPQ